MTTTKFWSDEEFNEFVEKTMNDCQSTDKAFREWLMSKKYTGARMYDSTMYLKCYNIYKNVRDKEQDHFITIIGGEGTGKSWMAYGLGAMLDPTFDQSHLCYSKNNFIDWLKKGKRGQVVWLDEGILFLFSREALGADNKDMVKLITLMRQRGLITIICIPRFSDIESKIREQRVDTLIDIRIMGHGRKYSCYNRRACRIISDVLRKKRTLPMAQIKCPAGTWWKGYINAHVPTVNGFDWEVYQKSKSGNFDEFLDEIKTKNPKTSEERLAKSTWVRLSKVEGFIGIPYATLYDWAVQGRIPAKKVLGKWLIKREDMLNIGGVAN